MTQTDADSTKNEDQREIADYFSSSRYARTQVQNRQRERMIANIEIGESKSLFLGIGGLAGLVLLFGALMPLGMEVVEEAFSNGQPQFAVMCMIIQTLFYPPIVCFAFATVTPMFWYGSVFVRFAMASLSVIPGCVAFVIVLSLVEPGENDIWLDFFAVIFPYFITAATIALGVQLWSPWTMAHVRDDPELCPPTGTRSMLELTGIAAIGCAVLANVDFSDVMEGLLFFLGFSVLASVGIISVLIIALGQDPSLKKAIAVTAAFAFAIAFFVNGFFAIMEYDWYALTSEFLLIAGVSLYGMCVIGILVAVCLRWLHHVGWTCVDRRRQRKPELIDTRLTGPDPLASDN